MPTRKVTAFGLGAALATLIAGTLEMNGIILLAGMEGAIAIIGGFIAGYLIRESPANNVD